MTLEELVAKYGEDAVKLAMSRKLPESPEDDELDIPMPSVGMGDVKLAESKEPKPTYVGMGEVKRAERPQKESKETGKKSGPEVQLGASGPQPKLDENVAKVGDGLSPVAAASTKAVSPGLRDYLASLRSKGSNDGPKAGDKASPDWDLLGESLDRFGATLGKVEANPLFKKLADKKSAAKAEEWKSKEFGLRQNEDSRASRRLKMDEDEHSSKKKAIDEANDFDSEKSKHATLLAQVSGMLPKGQKISLAEWGMMKDGADFAAILAKRKEDRDWDREKMKNDNTQGALDRASREKVAGSKAGGTSDYAQAWMAQVELNAAKLMTELSSRGVEGMVPVPGRVPSAENKKVVSKALAYHRPIRDLVREAKAEFQKNGQNSEWIMGEGKARMEGDLETARVMANVMFGQGAIASEDYKRLLMMIPDQATIRNFASPKDFIAALDNFESTLNTILRGTAEANNFYLGSDPRAKGLNESTINVRAGGTDLGNVKVPITSAPGSAQQMNVHKAPYGAPAGAIPGSGSPSALPGGSGAPMPQNGSKRPAVFVGPKGQSLVVDPSDPEYDAKVAKYSQVPSWKRQ